MNCHNGTSGLVGVPGGGGGEMIVVLISIFRSIVSNAMELIL